MLKGWVSLLKRQSVWRETVLQRVVLPKVDQKWGQEYKTRIHNTGIKPQKLEEFDSCDFFATQVFVTPAFAYPKRVLLKRVFFVDEDRTVPPSTLSL